MDNLDKLEKEVKKAINQRRGQEANSTDHTQLTKIKGEISGLTEALKLIRDIQFEASK